MPEQLVFPGFETIVDATRGGAGRARVRVGEVDVEVSNVVREGNSLRFDLDGQHYAFDVLGEPGQITIADAVQHYIARRSAPATQAAANENSLVSRMPGKVQQLLAVAGSVVQAGTPLLILEAMKMEHQVVAPVTGTLHAYLVTVGQRVMPGDLLAELEPLAEV